MRQRRRNGFHPEYLRKSLLSRFNDEDKEAFRIILSLPTLISESLSRSPPRLELKWGAKRRRSALELPISPPPPSCEGEKERKPKLKINKSSSPTSPLCFLSSESDHEKIRFHSRNKISIKKTKEEYLELIRKLTQTGNELQTALKKVKEYREVVLAENLFWKGKKREFQLKFHRQPFIVDDQTVHKPHITENFQDTYTHAQDLTLVSSSGSGLVRVNSVGPHVIPDVINMMIEEETILRVDSSQPSNLVRTDLTDNKAQTAEARRQRMVKIKAMKKSHPRCR